ncbi:thioesterase family protein [Colwellia sp. RSH04]|uniref:acyl-CoA thioesterase n=1 Tax=Colwellia sp. RSH04 TaxID=2305464 RepID=UPI000E5907AF|nr:thioesterase family protein [Colwellia sp. RSH04]RHW75794.1 acyl-CoA thioesterase [Colwellia sp. RSH04]
MSKQTCLSTSVDIEIPFHDCDPMHIVWHGNYPRYFEVARCQLLRLFNYDYLDMQESGYMWPIVDMRVKYVGSAKFTQVITVTATLVEYEHRIKINYLITDKVSGAKLTKGHTVQAAVSIATDELQLESPAILLEKLQPLLATLKED